MVDCSEKLYAVFNILVFCLILAISCGTSWTQITQTRKFSCSSFFSSFLWVKVEGFQEQAHAVSFSLELCAMNTVTLLLPSLSQPCLPLSGIKSWHFSLPSSHQLQYSRKETLISSCFPLGHPSYSFHSYCSNLLVTKGHFELWRSLCLWLCLSWTPSELPFSKCFLPVCSPVCCLSLVFCVLTIAMSFQLADAVTAPVCLEWCCPWFTALPLSAVLAASPSWHHTWAVYLWFFFSSHMSLFLSPNWKEMSAISLMQKC